VIEKGKKGIAQPAKHDALCMRVAEPPPAECRRVSSEIGGEELNRDQYAEYDGDQQRDDCRHTVGADKYGIDPADLCLVVRSSLQRCLLRVQLFLDCWAQAAQARCQTEVERIFRARSVHFFTQ